MLLNVLCKLTNIDYFKKKSLAQEINVTGSNLALLLSNGIIVHQGPFISLIQIFYI